ncbi:MAG: hypothetical protein ACLP59_09845 [Bryobacteraceae bacterium]
MLQKLKRTNRKRLASLTALGAGALGVAACPANANDIVFSGVINTKIGPPPTTVTYTIPGPGPGGAGGVLKTQIYVCSETCFGLGLAVDIFSKPGKYGTQFRFLAEGRENSYAQGEPQGAVWGTAAGKSTKSAVIIYTYDRAVATMFTATDRYLLFRFQGGALKHDIYGWARIQIPPPDFAEVVLVDWAYDPTGVRLPAGYHGAGQSNAEDIGTSEPSALDATGLPALALGAPGLRRWRAARAADAAKAAASTPAH